MKRRHLWFFLNTFVLIAPPLTGAEPRSIQRPTLVLGQAEQRILKIPGLKRFSLGGPQVRAVILPFHSQKPSLPSEELLLKGVLPGICDLWVWKQDGSTEHRTLRVEKWQTSPFSSELFTFLQDLEEIEVIPLPQKILLRGEVSHVSEVQKIAFVKETFPKEVHSQVSLASPLLKQGVQILQEKLIHLQPHSLNILTHHGQILIQGFLESIEDQNRILPILKHAFPLFDQDISLSKNPLQSIYLRILLAEIHRGDLQALGIQWPHSGLLKMNLISSQVEGPTNFEGLIQLLSEKTSAQVLANPELVVSVPGEAELFSGAQLPIEQQGRFYSNVKWKNHGLGLKLKLLEMSGNQVRLEIEVETSQLLPTPHMNTKIPSVRTNRLKTKVKGILGKPLLLCGLFQETQQSQVSGVPWASEIPLIGTLFGNHQNENRKSELIVILLPHSLLPPAVADPWGSEFPEGFVPPPRNWIAPDQMQELTQHPEFPWNVL